MPRRQGRAVPRLRRGKPPPKPSMPVTLKGRHAKALTRELIKANQQSNKPAASNDALAKTQVWRFRRHLPPFAWLACLLLAGLILPATAHPLIFGIIASIIAPVLLVLFTRHLPGFAKHAADVAAVLTSLWLPFLASRGLRTCLPALLITWAICAALWVRHYRWRPAQPPAETSGADDDVATWRKLAEEKRWNADLTDPEEISGGRKWVIRTDGIKTHIGHIMSEPRSVPAAWHRPRTEAYVEPDPSAIESRGVLTLLDRGTLEGTVPWDGKGFSVSGVARIGRFADGMPVRIRAWNPRNGTVHTLVAGTTGAGKSVCLDDLIWLALSTEAECGVRIVPVILDPQNGQSLPQWQGRVLYAAGVEECARMVRALDVARDDRSRRLASMTWKDGRHKVKGMNFFDPHLSGLPIIMPVYEEAPQLLNGDGNARLGAEMTQKVAKGGKLGRKAGEEDVLAAQIPSLAELGGDQALRAMLAGGNVISLRTAERVSAGMLGLDADPSALPKYFPDGTPTAGLGYAVAVDNRQAPMRIDLPGRDPRHEEMDLVLPDDGWMEAMNRVLDKTSPTSTVAPASPPPAPETPAEPEPEGRTCADAVWMVLSDAGRDMDRGEVIQWAGDLATGAWSRGKPFSIRAVGNALNDLAAGKYPGRAVIKPRGDKGGVYRAVPEDLKKGAA